MSGDAVAAINPINYLVGKGTSKAVEAIVPKPKMPELPQDPSLDPATVAATAQAARDQRRRIAASSTLINPGGLGPVGKDSLVRRTLLGS